MKFPRSLFAPSLISVGCVFVSAGIVTEAVGAWPRSAVARSMVRGYSAEPLATDTARPAERAFLEKASESSRLQLRLAELGASQATSAEVRGHAEQLKSDNRQLVEALSTLMQRKGAGAGLPTGETAPDAYARMAEKSGADFDREFVLTLAQVHEATINLFEQAAAESKDTDVRDLAAAQLPMLRAHRNRIIELKKAFE